MKPYQEKNIILTGGSGFIGSGVLRALNDKGFYNIVIVDDLGSSEKWKNTTAKKFYDFIHKDTLFSWLENRENEIEAFLHLGACSSTVETNGNYLLENNTRFSIRLAEYALTYGHPFIYASSAATYGDGSLGFSDQHETIEQYIPLNMYGYSKQLFDLWLYRHNLLDKVVGLKYFNVYGPNEYHKGRMASAIIKMVTDAKETGVIRLFKSSEPAKYKDGEQARDFIYVKDAAEMTVQFLERDARGIFNVGTGAPQSWNTLARSVFAALDMTVRIEYIDMPKDLMGKYQNYTCADMKKSQENGLLMPQFSLQEAVRDYVSHYLLERNFW